MSEDELFLPNGLLAVNDILRLRAGQLGKIDRMLYRFNMMEHLFMEVEYCCGLMTVVLVVAGTISYDIIYLGKSEFCELPHFPAATLLVVGPPQPPPLLHDDEALFKRDAC